MTETMKVLSHGLMVLKSLTQDGIVVNPIMLAMKTVHTSITMGIGMIDLVHIYCRATSVALQVRFYHYYYNSIYVCLFVCLVCIKVIGNRKLLKMLYISLSAVFI